MENQIKNINNSRFWPWFGIITLWLSGFGLILFVPQNVTDLIKGVYIGEGTVFIMWAIKETFVYGIKKRK